MTKILDFAMAAGAAAAVAMSAFGAFAGECEEIPERVLRLHILADSDSESAQTLKLGVRDLLLEEYGERLSASDSRSEAESTAQSLLPEIEAACDEYLSAAGADYGAEAELVEMYFTTRQYGDVTLPAGDYHALRITLGSGEGHNWWCVMFPPLCIPAASEKAASDSLFSDFTGDKLQIKFAIFEFFKSLLS